MSKYLKTPREVIEAQLAGKVVQEFIPSEEGGGIWYERCVLHSCKQSELDLPLIGFRIKPKVRVIRECNGYDLYPCETKPLEFSTDYYLPNPLWLSQCFKRVWVNDEKDNRYLAQGFVYLNPEHAKYHADAMCHTCEVEEEIEDEE